MDDDLVIFDGGEEELNINEDEDFFPVNYDYEEVFDTKILPLVRTLQNLCNEFCIPMLTSFQYKNSPEQTMLCTSVVMPPTRTCEKLEIAMKHLLK